MAVPQLSDAQRDILATAIDDGPRLEEPALHALLSDVRQWEAVDEAGAQVPDYPALLADPAADRGGLFLIEGQFAGRARRFKLAEENPTVGDALTEWVLVVQDEPEEVAVVYFVDPDGTLEAPNPGAEVRVVGRFYKVWSDRDQDGNPARYLTFVARTPKVLGAHVPAPGLPMLPMLLVVAVLGGIYLLIRRMGKQVDGEQIRRRSMPRAPDDVILSDPAEALQRMADEQKNP